ncbi:fasciclin domain-containing protein [Cecembia lonarensis]|uniref:Fasciclin domain protein n=1 Tax=Cecembia lonarensis (strain CCUG 58316 / KCTC 22772 / LW9) TaxID=1225176 RepID=K1L807_CECL9|nr:fasciclin domain-containing protein [Cecembia lonarensis]EKB50796.1 Fasciclin domain protein [Cecembia lonarensis LW9]
MKKKSIFNSLLTIPLMGAFLALGFSSCSDDEGRVPDIPTPNIVEIADATPQFSTLVAAVQTAGLIETLSSPGPFTVFAPTNDAFETFLTENNLTADQLLANPNLGTILTYHVVGASVPSSAVGPGSVNTVADLPFFISEAPNGNLWINGNTRIIDTDINASNGIIHVLDNVITPPTQNIAEIAIAATEAETPEFTQLVAALVRAELAGAFTGGFEDNFTVFAPTDAAFEELYTALGVGGVDEIPLETLTNVLLYHVVPARAFSQDLREGAELPTLLEDATLTVNLSALQINESGLVADMLNIHATNGVIHVIDSVLLP